jgi:hypothetical protein
MASESQSSQRNSSSNLDAMHLSSVTGLSILSFDNKIIASGIDTEATSESEAAARFDYTGVYRLSMIYDESSLQTSHHNVISVGGFVAFRPISGDDYHMVLDISQNSDVVLQGSIFIAPCMDYGATNIDQEESPYDDVIAVRDLIWVNKGKKHYDESNNTSQFELTETEQQHQLEDIIVSILSKCDMIRFVGDILVLEGPKGAIECVVQS